MELIGIFYNKGCQHCKRSHFTLTTKYRCKYCTLWMDREGRSVIDCTLYEWIYYMPMRLWTGPLQEGAGVLAWYIQNSHIHFLIL